MILNDLTNLSLVSISLPPSLPSPDELRVSSEHSKKVFERKKAEQDEKIKTLEETITVQSEIIAKSQSQDRKITELEERFHSSLSVNTSIQL